VRLSGPGGVVAGLGGAQPPGGGAGAGDVGIEGQPAGDGGAEPGVGEGGGPLGERRTRRDADAGLAGSRQDREEPRAGTLLSGQADLGPAEQVKGWRRAGRSLSGQPRVRGCQPIIGPGPPPGSGDASGPGQVTVDLPGDVPLEDPDHLGLGTALGQAAGHVGPGAGIVAQPGDHDAPQGAVGLPVTAAVEPPAGHLARGRRDGRGAAQARPGRLGPQPARVVPGGDQQRGRGVDAHAVQRQQLPGRSG